MIRATTFAGRHVAVFGLGQSGLACVRSLVEGGATVTAWDDNETARAAAQATGALITDLKTADWSTFSSLVLAPGVPLTHPAPHWTVEMARAAGVEIIGDIEIFIREREAHAAIAPFIAVTGTNGKSTTTALIAHLLAAFGVDVQMGGNIGRAILTLEPPAPDRVHVVEMSSFQIDLTPSLHPSVGVLLNITPDHLDRHGSFENYASIKERLITAADIAVVGADDDATLGVLRRKATHGAVAAVSARRQVAPGYCLSGTTIVASNSDGLAVKLADLSGITTLRGSHNAENAIAAVAAVRETLSLAGHAIDGLDWQGALQSFSGLPHRLEEIAKRGRVVFINDSKATNADSTEKALLSFAGDIYWIAGGLAKDGGIASLKDHFGRVAKAYLIGDAATRFADTLSGSVETELSQTLEQAVARAAADAAASNADMPVVLLSPSCASYDQFKNFEVRGDAFRTLVAALPNIEMRRRS